MARTPKKNTEKIASGGDAKKPVRKQTFKTTAVPKEKIQDMSVPDVLRTNFMPYAMSVIVSRALPDVADGLKPAHRKVLYTMYEMGLMGSNRTKSANIAARTLLLNPHSDEAQYETMVRMTQNNETLLMPLVDGKGSFGKHYSRDTAFASSRYTEAKLMPVAHEFFDSIKKDAVDFVDNYDGTRKEPVLLPVTFPNILANPTEGIAVGLASSIPSFNIVELCNATIEHIKHPAADLSKIMPGPDFTTGAYLLYQPEKMAEIYQTGQGSIILRAKYKTDTKSRIIEILEIPYSTTAEAVIDQVVAGVKAGKITEISDIRNEIDINGFKLAIDYKKGINPDELMKKLYRLTSLQDTYSFNMTVLVNGHPKVLGVYDILDEWIAWRRVCITREVAFDLNKTRRTLHLLQGLEKILLNIPKAIKIIRETETDAEVIPALMKGFKIDEEQAAYVAEIKLRNLNKDYILNRTKDIANLEKEAERLQKIIESKKEIDKLMIKALQDVIKKYGKERKTEIIPYVEEVHTPLLPARPSYRVHIFTTRDGYLKRIPVSALPSFKPSPNTSSLSESFPEVKMKDGDEIVSQYEASSDDEIVVFTDKANCYKLYDGDIPDHTPAALGSYLPNVCNSDADESILFACPMSAFSHFLFIFSNGKVAKVPVSSYETKQKRKKLVSAYYDGEKLVRIMGIKGDEEIGIEGDNRKLLILSTKIIPEKSTKNTQGVQVLRLPEGAQVRSAGRSGEYGLDSKAGFGCKNIPASGGKYERKKTG